VMEVIVRQGIRHDTTARQVQRMNVRLRNAGVVKRQDRLSVLSDVQYRTAVMDGQHCFIPLILFRHTADTVAMRTAINARETMARGGRMR